MVAAMGRPCRQWDLHWRTQRPPCAVCGRVPFHLFGLPFWDVNTNLPVPPLSPCTSFRSLEPFLYWAVHIQPTPCNLRQRGPFPCGS